MHPGHRPNQTILSEHANRRHDVTTYGQLMTPVRVSRSMRRWNLNLHYHHVVLDAIGGHHRSALDVGCGDGMLSFDLANRGLDVVGIDVHEPSIERARAATERSESTQFVCADLFEHPFEPESFDVVASIAMLHHVDATQGLRRLRSLVRPGGALVVVGFALPSDPIDLALIVAGLVRTSIERARGRYWEHGAPTCWPPPLSMRALRSLIARELPGARVRRRLGHRYSIVWTAP